MAKECQIIIALHNIYTDLNRRITTTGTLFRIKIRIITSKAIFVSVRYRVMHMRRLCLFWSLIPVVITVMLSSSITSVFSSTSQTQPSEDEINQSVRQINENNKSIDRLALFARQCTDLIESKDMSVIPTCDAVFQKFNIDIGKFFAENKAVIESIIYPYTLPPNIQNKSTLNSSGVIGSSDPYAVLGHNDEGRGYMEKIGMLSQSCIGAASLVTECMGVFKSLNDHFRDFNTNTQAEFDDVLTLVFRDLTIARGSSQSVKFK